MKSRRRRPPSFCCCLPPTAFLIQILLGHSDKTVPIRLPKCPGQGDLPRKVDERLVLHSDRLSTAQFPTQTRFFLDKEAAGPSEVVVLVTVPFLGTWTHHQLSKSSHQRVYSGVPEGEEEDLHHSCAIRASVCSSFILLPVCRYVVQTIGSLVEELNWWWARNDDDDDFVWLLRLIN